MSDKLRWRYGDANPVVAAVDSDTVIEIGDLLWLDVDDAKPASMVNDAVSREAGAAVVASDEELQEFFVDNFLGVAMQRSVAGDATPIRVATAGVFEFDCPSGTWELGDIVGPDGSGQRLHNQQVTAVTDSDQAIARVARRKMNPNYHSVLVAIRSTVMTGGILTR